ncbi:MAG TPA: hypothetical protein VK828_22010 [Terriglobales bacterium]|jgi:hypothetical protein|nr:hypothetical protein [Terriglobales bacterium]
MPVFGRWLPPAFALLTTFAAAQLSVQQSDRAIAARVLGPRWQQLSRRAGTIFTGTVLATSISPDRKAAGAIPAIELIFRVDEPIAGVKRGQILTVHEWSGVWSMQRPMTKGQRILIFLYPPSRLGLTSPVGGSLGQIALDSSGENISADALERAAVMSSRGESSLQQQSPPTASTTVLQLGRAIRAARSEKEKQ